MKIIGIVGFILFLYGIISAIFFSNIFWYSTFVIGGTLFLGYLNYKCKDDSILKIFEKDKIKVLKIYLFYLLATILIEFSGRFILNLWAYPYFTGIDKIIHVFLIGYPFAFFFIYESFTLIKKLVKGTKLSIFLAIIINAFLHEIPNTFVWTWEYNIPYINFEILQINIVVIVGWSILIAVPLLRKKIISFLQQPLF